MRMMSKSIIESRLRRGRCRRSRRSWGPCGFSFAESSPVPRTLQLNQGSIELNFRNRAPKSSLQLEDEMLGFCHFFRETLERQGFNISPTTFCGSPCVAEAHHFGLLILKGSILARLNTTRALFSSGYSKGYVASDYE